MKFNEILFVTFLCLGAQSGMIFGSEGEAPQSQSWGEWAGSYMTSAKAKAQAAAAAAKKRAQQAAGAVMSYPGERWSAIKKRTEVDSPLAVATTGAALSAQQGALMGVIYTLEAKMGKALIPSDTSLAYLTEMFGGVANGGLVKVGISLAVPTFLLSYGMQKVFEYYHKKDITRQAAVSQIKDLIFLKLADSLTYPTRSTKLHALLKKNEFLVEKVEDADGLLAQACSDLSKQLVAIPYSFTEKEKDNAIDRQLSLLREKLVNITSLDSQLETISTEDITNVLEQLGDPLIQAKLSLVRRLQQQKLVEKNAPDTFEKTSSSKFYQPMTEEEEGSFEERKKAWEAGMKEARKMTTEWGKERKQSVQ